MNADSAQQSAGNVQLLLDTSFCLHLIRTRPRNLIHVFADYGPGQVAVSALTVATLQACAEGSCNPEMNRIALARFLLPLRVVEFDAAAAQQLSEVVAWWGVGSGSETGLAQMLAAQALLHNATLVTAEPEQYAAIPGLRVNSPSIAAHLADAVPPRLSGTHTLSVSNSRPLQNVPGAIVAVGSHDLTLDLLGDYIHSRYPEVMLVSAHVGSLGGLLALQRNEAHLAGSHLLDEDGSDYNVGYIKRLLTPYDIRVVLLGFVSRQQGLILAKGNPKKIHGVEDLAREDVLFINRQQGAGTRILLDTELDRIGIRGAHVRGYDREESSHSSIAAAVAGGDADTGLGIRAAAHALDLDFIPLSHERYDLVIPVERYESDLLQPLLSFLRSPDEEFLGRVKALGGYEVSNMGKVLAEI